MRSLNGWLSSLSPGRTASSVTKAHWKKQTPSPLDNPIRPIGTIDDSWTRPNRIADSATHKGSSCVVPEFEASVAGVAESGRVHQEPGFFDKLFDMAKPLLS
jgi:hypothetical protein